MAESMIRISDAREDLRRCRLEVERMARDMGFGGTDLGDVVTSVFEACVNAVTHGMTGDGNDITLTIRSFPDRIEAEVTDHGCGFDCPEHRPIPPPTVRRGRGVPLMQAFMDEVRIERHDGCKVTLVKYLPDTKH